MKKIATLFIADCTDGTKERRNLSPRVLRVKNTKICTNLHGTIYFYIASPKRLRTSLGRLRVNDTNGAEYLNYHFMCN